MDISDEELLSRARTLANAYAELAPALAKKMEEFGRMRKELQLLAVEINQRGLLFDAPTD